MDNLCSVVVTYNPADYLLNNIGLLRSQASDVVVVDNGSSALALRWLREQRNGLGFALIENGANLGIATALNRGVRWALERGHDWIALFDQDSTVIEGYFDAMSTADTGFRDHGAKVGIYCPRYIDRQSGREKPVFNRDEHGEPLTSMTSGSVMNAKLFAAVGFFAEELFIYCVDDDFCLRARQCGYRLMLVPGAKLLHKEGAAQFRSFFGRSFYVTGQSAQKRYYITRNQLWMYRRYPEMFPGLGSSGTNLLRVIKTIVRTLLLEGQRVAKARAIIRGAADCLRARMGKTVEL